MYFSDAGHKTIGSVDALGRVRVAYQGGEIALPRGVALSGDQAMLVVSDAQGRFSWSFQIAANGSIENGEPFYRLGGAEVGWRRGGRAVGGGSIGDVGFSTPVGVPVCEGNGRIA